MKQILIPLMVFYLCATPELHSQARVDTHYHFPVYFPLFTQTKEPKIYLDGYHNNLHQKHTGFRPLSELLSDMGFEIEALNQPILKDDVLESCDILIIANAIHFGNRGRGYNPIYSAFTTDEIKVINRWVSGGGSLLLIADHMPFAGAAQDLAESFGVHLVNGFAGISEGVCHQMVAGCGNKILLNKSHVGTSCGWWWRGRLRDLSSQSPCDSYASSSDCHHFVAL